MFYDLFSQNLTNKQNGQQAYFSSIDLEYAYSQLQLHRDNKKGNFFIHCRESSGTYRFKTGLWSH